MSAWQVVWEVGRTISTVLVGLGLPSLIAYFIKDRRRNRAASEVAERTVGPEVDLKETGAADARLVYVQREMDLERQFTRQQIADRDAEIARQRDELSLRDQLIAHRDQIIAELRSEIEELQTRLTAVRDRLSELTDTPQESH